MGKLSLVVVGTAKLRFGVCLDVAQLGRVCKLVKLVVGPNIGKRNRKVVINVSSG